MPTGCYPRVSTAKKISLPCQFCKKEIVVLESVYRSRGNIKYCSRACSAAAATKESTFTKVACSQCGTEFSKRTDHLTKTNFCSAKCLGLSKQVDGAKWKDPLQIKEYMQAYVKGNREAANARNLKWSYENKEKKLAIQKKYRENNSEFLAASARARRFGIKAGAFTHKEWIDLKERYGNKCLCCNKPESLVNLEVDHVVSFKSGGIHAASNIQPLCRSCNATKGAKTIDYRPF